jgi:hypothetical protein
LDHSPRLVYKSFKTFTATKHSRRKNQRHREAKLWNGIRKRLGIMRGASNSQCPASDLHNRETATLHDFCDD